MINEYNPATLKSDDRPSEKILAEVKQVQRNDDIWVRVFGMLQQTWCRVEQNKECIELSFFDDYKAIFDRVKYPTIDIARAALIKNHFCPAWDIPDAIFQQKRQNEPYTEHPLQEWMDDYSSGKNWVEPSAYDPHEYVFKPSSFKKKPPDFEPERSRVICIHLAPDERNPQIDMPAVTQETIKNIEIKSLARLKATEQPE